MPDAEEHDYEAYLEEFNEDKANDIKAKNIELQEAEKDAETVAAQLEIAEDNASKAKGKLNQRKQALEKAEAKLQEQKENQPEFTATDAFQDIQEEINDISVKIENHQAEKEGQLAKLNNHISDLDEQIEAAQKTIHKAQENKRTNDRIKELEAERREVAEQLEQVESDLHLMEEFVRARSAYVTDKVNEKFDHVTWKLFEEQINGGISETADAVYKGVPFSKGLNNAGRIQAGLDIINTLSKHYGKSAPVWIDNAEGIIDIPEYELQIIALYVSASDDKLRIESREENKLAEVV
ncbi:hypothetical protein [Fodinibius sp.]|uniref:hypothetical protein n=1 Tax=Fodinibius sp. TaxID=1872440 RepID=UPI002ACD70CC|nr:hypothetical protein [Fodinibius sp.]MDZ7658032.1 hypothetical protein [Fodinibius sp.]